jgi:hypothetical protein
MKTEQTRAASNGSAADSPGVEAALVGLESAAPTTTIPGPGFRL